MEATNTLSWGFAPDYPHPNRRRPQQNVEVSDDAQHQNPSMYDTSYGYSQVPFTSDSFVTQSNGFIQQQQQYINGGYANQPSIAMAGTAAPISAGLYSIPNSRAGDPLDAQTGFVPAQPEQQRHYYPNPAPSFNNANQPMLSPPYQSTSPQPMLASERNVSGPPPPQLPNGQQFMYPHSQHSATNGSTSPMQKRQRQVDRAEETGDDEREAERERMKPQGACSRCKSLKVKCEFRTDTDPCRRCLNAGAECQIPGRRKRRTPPKREHLLNQIREQATQIEQLMAQLEKVNQFGSSPIPRSDRDLSSPGISPSAVQTPASSYFGHSPAALTGSDSGAVANGQDIENWIAKARESLAQFGGIIGGMGGSAQHQKLVADQEESGDDGFYTGDEGLVGEEFEFAVENSDDGDGDYQHMNTNGNGGVHRQSSSAKRSAVPPVKHAALPTEASAVGLFAQMSLDAQREGDGPEQQNAVGVASMTYFRESPAPEGAPLRRLNAAQVHAPQILKRGIVTTIQVEQLFDIYHKYMNLSLSLLDPILYTPQTTFWRSPFLFTAICAIASRYYSENGDLYPQIMHYAHAAAAESLVNGTKNVEMASAYILLSLYPVPARRWEDDRSWLYLGLAIRVATDLNLQKPPAKAVNEAHAREMLNRTRVWLNCFNLDRSTGSQHGKTPTIRDTDYMACHSEDWWRQSQYNIPNFDIHICGYNAELRIMSRFVSKVHSDPSHPTGFDKSADCERLAAEADDELSRLGEKWFAIASLSEDPQSQFRTSLLRLAYSYARLATLSYAFQQASSKSKASEENHLLLRCLRAATDVVNSYIQNVAKPNQLIFLRHGPEAQSVFVTFASAFLVKLLHPKYTKQISPQQRLEIRSLVERAIGVLSSPEVSIDERHAPRLYSRFLQGLLDTPMAKADISSPTSFANALPRTRSRKTKTMSRSSPVDRLPFTGMYSPTDPNVSPSLTNVSFDSKSQSFGQVSSRSTQNNTGTNHSTPEVFQPPLPFDSDFLSSMQQFTEPGVWADYAALAGMGWMSNFQDVGQMPDDSLIFNNFSPSGLQE